MRTPRQIKREAQELWRACLAEDGSVDEMRATTPALRV